MAMMRMTRADRSLLGDWWWTVDRGMLIAVGIMMAIGVMLVAAASPAVAIRIGLDANHFVIRHIIMLSLSCLAMMITSLLTPRLIWRMASIGLIGGLLMMMLIPFMGMEIKGAQRWLHLFGLSIQPSEFVKPAFAIVAAWLLWQQKEKPDFAGNAFAAGLYCCVVALLLLQPDLGMTVVVTCMFIAQVCVAGLRLRYLVLAGLAGAIGIVLAYYSFGHVQSRIDRYLNPESGNTYQIDQSLAAFKNGGFIGTGPGQGKIKQHLPDSHADFIFAVAGEELGFLFTLPIIALFLYVLLRGFDNLVAADNLFVVLACTGLLTMFGLQALVHMGSAMHVLPAKGMTLPFISYGGTSMIAMGISFGAILALTRRQGRFAIVRGLSRTRGGAAGTAAGGEDPS